jgi:hypothetical protein
MEPTHIFQRLAKLEFFKWLTKKNSFFPLYGELEIYALDMNDIDSHVRTSFNALAIRFLKDACFINVKVLRGMYLIEFPNDPRETIEVKLQSESLEDSSYQAIRHALDLIEEDH